MRHIFIPVAFFVALHGCLPTHSDEWSQFEFEPRTVYVWNGTECIEAERTSEQLSQMESLTALVKRDGRIVPFALYAENVPPSEIKSLLAQGGTIGLPSGETLTFPRGLSPSRSAIISTGKATLENGKTITYDGGTFSGPLPEITTPQ